MVAWRQQHQWQINGVNGRSESRESGNEGAVDQRENGKYKCEKEQARGRMW